MGKSKGPPRYRAVGSTVLDSRLGEGETPIIHADNPKHCKALVRALNAYEDGVTALRHIRDHASVSSECKKLATDALDGIEQVITS